MVAEGVLGLAEARGTDPHGEHCPFLNRSDKRCSNCLSLDRLDHAFDYCFGEYKACPVYLEMLVERRVRRLCGLLTPPEPGRDHAPSESPDGNRSTRRPPVPLTLAATRPGPGPRAYADGHAQHAAGGPFLSASPRL